ncbi:DUF6760 family protein [aff. Roholtiella sp. LEGE 12411]
MVQVLIANYFYWSQDDILNLEYSNRQCWVNKISKINHKLI